MSITRAELCRLFDWTIDTYKGLLRYGHLPLDEEPAEGWRSFTAFDATKIAMANDLVNNLSMSRLAAADFVRSAGNLISERWVDVINSGKDLFEGRATDELLLARVQHPMAVTCGPTVVCLRQSELGEVLGGLEPPIVRMTASNISRSVTGVMGKAQHAGIELGWSE